VDSRRDALERWLRAQLHGAAFTLVPASEDASFRRYFRATLDDGRRYIVMDAPPEREPCAPFVHVAALLRAAGVNAPEVHAQDLAAGFLLLTDLGTQTYLDALASAGPGTADALFRDATETLLRWQLASRPGVLPAYDAALLRQEMALFPQWYLGRHRGIALSTGEAAGLERVFALLIASAAAQPQVFVHRDFMPRNLMLSEPNPGVLDFQDAVLGPISYDIVSLLRDAFISWEEGQVLDWCVRYWERARAAGLPVDADFAEFFRAFEWMGLQRHLKVLGIFARLTHRDGKAKYVADTPRFLRYARAVAERYAPLASLARLLRQLEEQAPHGVPPTP
jgi:aminoglycoside/choline kinase family phosphotransferase